MRGKPVRPRSSFAKKERRQCTCTDRDERSCTVLLGVLGHDAQRHAYSAWANACVDVPGVMLYNHVCRAMSCFIRHVNVHNPITTCMIPLTGFNTLSYARRYAFQHSCEGLVTHQISSCQMVTRSLLLEPALLESRLFTCCIWPSAHVGASGS